MDKLDAAKRSEAGQLLTRAVDLLALLKMRIPISLDEVDAEELFAMLIIEEERDRHETEKAKKN